MDASNVIELVDVTKKFPGVTALENVSISVRKGEIRALVGENGAGKSTVAKIIAGVFPPSSGHMLLNRTAYHPEDILEAHRHGVSILYQEPSLEPYLSVGENVFLAMLSSFTRSSLLSWRKLNRQAATLLEQIGAGDINPRALVSGLTIGQKKLVELARALSYEPRLLLVDEATAALNRVEAETLFENLHRLKTAGTSILYISHRLEEVFRLCNTVTILRDGRVVKTLDTACTTIDELSSLMVGREIDLSTYYRDRRKTTSLGPQVPALEVDGLFCSGGIEDVSFKVNSGEILGIAGLIGSGSEDVLQALFGVRRIDRGKISIRGIEVKMDGPPMAIANGIAYVPKERDEEGLIPRFSVKENMCMAVLKKFFRGFRLDRKGMERLSQKYRNRLGIKTPSVEMPCVALSGGNRQKVVLGKWLATEPTILLLNNPTRGIDIGAKREVYELVNELAEKGMAVVMASDELPELLGMSDRLMVMKKGRVSHLFDQREALTEEEIIPWMI